MKYLRASGEVFGHFEGVHDVSVTEKVLIVRHLCVFDRLWKILNVSVNVLAPYSLKENIFKYPRCSKQSCKRSNIISGVLIAPPYAACGKFV